MDQEGFFLGDRLWLRNGLVFESNFDTYILPSSAWQQPYFKIPVPSKVSALLAAEEKAAKFVHLFDSHHAMMEDFVSEITADLDSEIVDSSEVVVENEIGNTLYEVISSESTDEFCDCLDYDQKHEGSSCSENVEIIDWWSYGNSNSSENESFHDTVSFYDELFQTMDPLHPRTSSPLLQRDGVPIQHWVNLRWEESESVISSVHPLSQAEEESNSFSSLPSFHSQEEQVQVRSASSLSALCQRVISSAHLTQKIKLPSSSLPEILTSVSKSETPRNMIEQESSTAHAALPINEQISTTVSVLLETQDESCLSDSAMNIQKTEENMLEIPTSVLEARCVEVAADVDVMDDEQCHLLDSMQLKLPLKQREETENSTQEGSRLGKRKKFSSIQKHNFKNNLNESAKAQVSPKLPRLLDIITSDPNMPCSSKVKTLKVNQQTIPSHSSPSVKKNKFQEPKRITLSKEVIQGEPVIHESSPPRIQRIQFRPMFKPKVHVNYLTQKLIIDEPVEVDGKARILVSNRHIDFDSNVRENSESVMEIEKEEAVAVEEEKETMEEEMAAVPLVEPKTPTRCPTPAQSENEFEEREEMPSSVETTPAAASVQEFAIEEEPGKKLVWKKKKGKQNAGFKSKQKKKKEQRSVNEGSAGVEETMLPPPPPSYLRSRKQKYYHELTDLEKSRVHYCDCLLQTYESEENMLRNNVCLKCLPVHVADAQKRVGDGKSEIVSGEVTVTEGVISNGHKFVQRRERITTGRILDNEITNPLPLVPLPPEQRLSHAQKLANFIKSKPNPKFTTEAENKTMNTLMVAGYQYSSFQPMEAESPNYQMSRIVVNGEGENKPTLGRRESGMRLEEAVRQPSSLPFPYGPYNEAMETEMLTNALKKLEIKNSNPSNVYEELPVVVSSIEETAVNKKKTKSIGVEKVVLSALEKNI